MDVRYWHKPLPSLWIKIISHLKRIRLVKHGDSPLVRVVHPYWGFGFNCCRTTCVLIIEVVNAELLVLWSLQCLVDWLLLLNLLAWFLLPSLSHVIRWCTILNIANIRVGPRRFGLSKCLRCVKAATFDHYLLLFLLWCWLVVLHVRRTWLVALE